MEFLWTIIKNGENMLVIKNDNARQIVLEISNHLANVEVKGDSVEHLYAARVILKQLFDSIENSVEENKTKEE